MWGVSSGGVTYINKSGDNWNEVARINIPGVKPVTSALNQQALEHECKTVQEVEKSVNNVYKSCEKLYRPDKN
ncbi:MAG: hypothetical protein P4L79_13975 [Legionella sp.]|uniref:hypothetical protein n=1 Tax=Legionella sp. TaxID=459 RepID=UPI00283AF53D|nr:hypothetical protein [Legionella sp.]